MHFDDTPRNNNPIDVLRRRVDKLTINRRMAKVSINELNKQIDDYNSEIKVIEKEIKMLDNAINLLEKALSR